MLEIVILRKKNSYLIPYFTYIFRENVYKYVMRKYLLIIVTLSRIYGDDGKLISKWKLLNFTEKMIWSVGQQPNLKMTKFLKYHHKIL